MRLRTKNGPLLAYLTALPVDQGTVTLPFATLEALVGPLSASARTAQSYWTEVAHRQLWRTTGWTARVNLVAQSVTFTRAPTSEQV